MNSSGCLARNHHRLSSLRPSMSADIRRYLTKSPHDLERGDSWRTRLSASLTPEVFPVLLYRIAHYLHASGWLRPAVLLTRCNQVMNKLYISPQSCIGPGLRLPHPAGVTFHGCAGSGLTIYSLGICCAHTAGWDGPIETGPALEDDVTVGAHAVLQGAIHVGRGSTVPQSVHLCRDAPARVLVANKLLRYSIRRRT